MIPPRSTAFSRRITPRLSSNVTHDLRQEIIALTRCLIAWTPASQASNRSPANSQVSLSLHHLREAVTSNQRAEVRARHSRPVLRCRVDVVGAQHDRLCVPSGEAFKAISCLIAFGRQAEEVTVTAQKSMRPRISRRR